MIFRKLKAGALQLTLFIAVVIALLLASFLILVNTYKQFNIKTGFVIETIDNSEKGIQYALQNTLKYKDSTVVRLNGEDYKSLKLKRNYWGIFERITSESVIKNYKFQKAALIGASQPVKDRMALYLEDNNKPLVVVGHTKLQGVVYLPQRGVKSGSISGHSYYGEHLIYGPTKMSNKLPKFSTELSEQLFELPQAYRIMDKNQFLDIRDGSVFNNSFYEPTQIIFSNGQIELSEISLTGNILVQSQTKIVVKSTAKLRDVILLAPAVEIQDNVVGTFQILANKSLVVGNNCTLNYPSALILHNNEMTFSSPASTPSPNQKDTFTQEHTPTTTTTTTSTTTFKDRSTSMQISIGSHTSINGVVAYSAFHEEKNFQPQIIIETDAKVVGEIYCNANLELKGTVFGTVYASNFVANQSGSIYQNHIYNGTIVVDELPSKYVGLELTNHKKGVLKWLY